jgi:hypothetical protein
LPPISGVMPVDLSEASSVVTAMTGPIEFEAFDVVLPPALVAVAFAVKLWPTSALASVARPGGITDRNVIAIPLQRQGRCREASEAAIWSPSGSPDSRGALMTGSATNVGEAAAAVKSGASTEPLNADARD